MEKGSSKEKAEMNWFTIGILATVFLFGLWYVVRILFGRYLRTETERLRRINEEMMKKLEEQKLKRKIDDEWLAVRTQVLMRDNYTCVNCEQTGGKLHVHHIIPVSEGGTDDLDNLVTLCAKCHSVQDGKGHNLINLEENDL